MSNQRLAAVCSVLLLACGVNACTSRGADEVEWARAALARNPAIEIIAVDEKTGVFTVKDVASGAISTLSTKDIVAAPAAPPAQAADPAMVANDAASQVAADVASPGPGEAASADPGETTDIEANESAAVVSEETTTTLATNSSGKTLMSGPGYSITRAGGGATRAASVEPGVSAPGLKPTRAEPIICQGPRFMRIDGQTIETTGNAIVAEDGCDLHITNARIRAGGVAVTVRNARVHITNSTIAGMAASLEASGNAEVYSTRSSFEGISRRFDQAVVNDLGGTVFR
ncbi:MAG: hypothetical protein R3F58_00315 [Steroidobacteraceae bacterium]